MLCNCIAHVVHVVCVEAAADGVQTVDAVEAAVDAVPTRAVGNFANCTPSLNVDLVRLVKLLVGKAVAWIASTDSVSSSSSSSSTHLHLLLLLLILLLLII